MRKALLGLAAIVSGCATFAPPTIPLEQRFLSPPGTVISASREEGLRAMMRLAATQEMETCVLYLPEKKAWITHAIGGTARSCEIDLTYSERYAKTRAGKRQEFWHTHTPHGIEYGSDEKNRWYWIVPSIDDLGQLYALGERLPDVRCVNVTPYGAFTYWGDAYDIRTVPARFVARTLHDGAAHLQGMVYGANEEDLPSRAQRYRGIVSLRFDTVKSD